MATTYTLSDVALKAGEPFGHAPIRITLCDEDGHTVPGGGHVIGSPGEIIKTHFFHAHPVTGEFSVDLIANADISPANTCYKVTIGGILAAIIQATADGDLALLEVTNVGPLGPPNASAAALAAEIAARIAGDQALQDEIDNLPGGGGGGAVDSVNGQTGVVVLDAGDVGALPTTGGTVTGPVVIDHAAGIAFTDPDSAFAAYLFPGGFEMHGTNPDSPAFDMTVEGQAGGAGSRHRVNYSGKHRWAEADGVFDTDLERTDVGELSLNGTPLATTTDIPDVSGFATSADLASAIAGTQPLDSDLSAIAALSTTSYGRALLALADAAAARTALGLGTAATQASTAFDAAGAAAAAQAASQPVDSDLTSIAALTTTSYGRAFLALANQAALMALLSAATTSAAGIVPLASSAEAIAGTDNTKAMTPADVAATVVPIGGLPAITALLDADYLSAEQSGVAKKLTATLTADYIASSFATRTVQIATLRATTFKVYDPAHTTWGSFEVTTPSAADQAAAGIKARSTYTNSVIQMLYVSGFFAPGIYARSDGTDAAFDTSFYASPAGVWNVAAGGQIRVPNDPAAANDLTRKSYVDAQVALAQPAPIFKRKASTTSRNGSTTPTSDPDLTTAALAISSTYILECYLVHQGNSTDDLRVNFTLPTGATIDVVSIGSPTNVSAVPWVPTARRINTNGTWALGNIDGQATPVVSLIRGTVIMSTNTGTFALQWSQNASSVNNCDLMAGSYMTLTKVA